MEASFIWTEIGQCVLLVPAAVGVIALAADDVIGVGTADDGALAGLVTYLSQCAPQLMQKMSSLSNLMQEVCPFNF